MNNKPFLSFILILISAASATLLAIVLIFPNDFNQYVNALIPNVYQDITDQSVHAQSLDQQSRLISISYQSVNVPQSANIEVISDNNDLIVYRATDVNLTQRLSYSFNTNLPAGSYILKISSPTMKTKVKPFELDSNQSDINIKVGTFNVVSSDFSISDMNGDGVINSLDMQLFLESL